MSWLRTQARRAPLAPSAETLWGANPWLADLRRPGVEPVIADPAVADLVRVSDEFHLFRRIGT